MKKFKILLLVAVFILMPVFVSAEDLTDEQIWESFVEKYKETYYVKSFEYMEDESLEITSTENALYLVVTDDDNSDSVSFSFTYADGILTYVPSTARANGYTAYKYTDGELIFLEDNLVQNCVDALSSLNENFADTFSYIDTTFTDLSLEKNGIEYSKKTYNFQTDDMANYSIDAITVFKLDLRNGITLPDIDSNEEDVVTISSTESQEEVVENPSTGIFTQYGIIAIAIIGLGTLGYVGIRKYSKFPQA